MRCTNPLYLEKYDVTVACGQCRACRITRSTEWAMRCMHEGENHAANIFTTLTFDDAHLPVGAALEKRHLQLFFKRLRRRLDKAPIKYFASGEYGGETPAQRAVGRPHYHAIIFGIGTCGHCHSCNTNRTLADKPAAGCKAIRDAWTDPQTHEPLGFVYNGYLSIESARYVADYVDKDSRGELYGGRPLPFVTMSQGIGKTYAINFADKLRHTPRITVYGKRVRVPRLYAHYADIPQEVIKQANAEYQQLWTEEFSEKYGDSPTAEIDYNRQRARNIDARESLRERTH